VGVFLSGGIDSSIVAALLVQAGVKVRAYALDFEPVLGNQGLSEFPYAQQVAEFLNIPLVKVSVTPQKIQQAIASTAQALDLPFGDGAPLPLFLLSQVASQETSVIFNGENGDQLFAGWTNKPLIAASVYNTNNPSGVKDFNQHYLNTFHALYGYESQIFQSDVYAQVQARNPQDWLQEALDPIYCSNLLARLRRASLMLKGAQNIQPRANNLALSQGLWVRSPFCDLPLTQWTFQLPGEFCLQGVCEKYILKRA
jgi:asparagine synthase (glutamine-hydrolysing)